MEPILGLDPAGMRLRPELPLSQQIHAQLKARILQGQLPAALRLPTTRELAAGLGVSRNTVVRAYEQLLAEGYLEARVGAGSYVARLQTDSTTPAASVVAPAAEPTTALWQRLRQYRVPRPAMGPPRAFRYGVPALDLFPTEVWARLQARFWRQAERQPLGYSDPAGLPRLRTMVAAYLSHSRGLHCTAEQVVITGGSQQAIALAALALLGPGERAAIESPGYRAAAAALSLPGGQVLPVPVDAQGLQIAALEALGPCRLAYVTPSHQFPSGVAMSLQRRLDLLAWAQRHDAYLLEDDYDGEYRYAGVPLAPLASLDASGRTLYIGSFSKLLFPGLRLGYLVAPATWAQPLAALRSLLDRHASIADQSVMADFIEHGHFLRHVRRVRRAAEARRDALLSSWQQHFGTGLPLAPVDAGLHALLPLESAAQEQQLHGLAEAAGIELGPLREVGSVLPASGRAGLLLGFAGVTQGQIRAAVGTLARAWSANRT
jgi:GntR family transcriptional regulator / MocR family aminotransferase